MPTGRIRLTNVEATPCREVDMLSRDVRMLLPHPMDQRRLLMWGNGKDSLGRLRLFIRVVLVLEMRKLSRGTAASSLGLEGLKEGAGTLG